MIGNRFAALVCTVALLVPQASKGCEATGGGNDSAPEMIANGSTRITLAMIGQTYMSKGPTDSAKKKHYKCEWRVINKSGKGDHFGLATGVVTITFRARNVDGVFKSKYCRMWIRMTPYA